MVEPSAGRLNDTGWLCQVGATAPPRSTRLRSLDAMRGLTVAAMIVVNNPGSWTDGYASLAHASWHGWTLADLVFPFFLLIVGVSLDLSLASRRDPGAGRFSALPALARRAVLLCRARAPVERVSGVSGTWVAARVRRAAADRALFVRRRGRSCSRPVSAVKRPSLPRFSPATGRSWCSCRCPASARGCSPRKGTSRPGSMGAGSPAISIERDSTRRASSARFPPSRPRSWGRLAGGFLLLVRDAGSEDRRPPRGRRHVGARR